MLGVLWSPVTINTSGSSAVIRGTAASNSSMRFTFADTGTPFEGQPCGCHALTGDGELDLDLKFDKQAVIDAFDLASIPNGTFVELEITGSLMEGGEFSARDCIKIVNH